MALTTTNGMSIDDLSAAPNGPGLAQQLGNQVDEFYGKSVASAAALPATGKYAGQQVWLVDVKGYATWDGATWQTDKGLVVPSSYGTGWADIDANLAIRVERINGWVMLYLGTRKNAASLAGETVCTLPTGYRPKRTIAALANNAGSPRAFTVNTSGQVSNDIAQSSSALSGLVGVISYPAA